MSYVDTVHIALLCAFPPAPKLWRSLLCAQEAFFFDMSRARKIGSRSKGASPAPQHTLLVSPRTAAALESGGCGTQAVEHFLPPQKALSSKEPTTDITPFFFQPESCDAPLQSGHNTLRLGHSKGGGEEVVQ